MNGFRVRADQLTARLDQYQPGDEVALLVARRDELLTIETAFGAEPPRQWRLEVRPGRHRDAAAAARPVAHAPGMTAVTDTRRGYARVLILWVVVLAALYAFQEYFS